MIRSYTLSLKSVFTEAEKIPDFVEKIGEESQIRRDLIDRVKLALSEAVTNAIVHGNQQNPEKQVSISVDINDSMITLSVRDEGEGFHASDIPDPVQEENLLSTGGRGLFLMKEYADEVSLGDGGTRVVMKFKR